MWVLCLPVLTVWACKSLDSWDWQGYSSHIFFMPSSIINNFLKAESGGNRQMVKSYEKIIVLSLGNYSSFTGLFILRNHSNL